MSSSRQPSGRQRGAQAVAHRDERRRRRRGLLWLLVALVLAAVAAAIVLPLALNGNDDDKQGSSRSRQSGTTGSGHAAAGNSGQRTAGNSGQRAANDSGHATAGGANGTASDNSGQQAANDSEQAGAGQSGGSPSLTAGGASLVARPSRLGRYVGRDARGRAVVVQKIVPGNGFWIGTSRRSRVYVEYGGRVGPDETKRFRPRVGDRVDLVGPVRPALRHPARTLKLGPADAKLVRRQGAFINADRVKRAT